nr:nitrate- and nitrite sensing domain-containing protein [Micromonospora sp. DSM 115978]
LAYGFTLADVQDIVDTRAFIVLQTLRHQELATFRRTANPEQLQAYEEVVFGFDVTLTDDYNEAVATRRPDQTHVLETEKWLQATSKTIHLTDQAADAISNEVAARSAELHADVRRRAMLFGSIALGLLAATAVTLVAVVRMLGRTPSTLRTRARRSVREVRPPADPGGRHQL